MGIPASRFIFRSGSGSCPEAGDSPGIAKHKLIFQTHVRFFAQVDGTAQACLAVRASKNDVKVLFALKYQRRKHAAGTESVQALK
jgi:hypothetical protein